MSGDPISRIHPPKDLARWSFERRAVEAAIWGMPIVAFEAMRQAYLRETGGRYGDILYLTSPADWKFQITTPNASSLYVYLNFNLKDGPVVLDFPAAVGAGLFGTIVDAWQTPLVDVGPEGDDQGKGGKYLFVPPGYKDTVPQSYFTAHFPTYNGYAVFRAIPETTSTEDLDQAISLVKAMRLYPLAQAGNPPASRHIDITGRLFDGIVRYDDTFYDNLARIISEEPVQTRDLVPMAELRTLGIEKGAEFKPDQVTRDILKKSIAEAHAFFMRDAAIGEPWWPNSQWMLPTVAALGAQTEFSYMTPEGLAIDERAANYFLACAPPKKLGEATFYLVVYHDATGQTFQGWRTYRLRVPPSIPAKQYWAVTVYNLETAAFIRDAPTLAIDSYQNPLKNPDGSVDVYFAPKPPAGKESSWIYTEPGKPWFAVFRFYGPEKAVFDKTWRLGEIVQANNHGSRTWR